MTQGTEVVVAMARTKANPKPKAKQGAEPKPKAKTVAKKTLKPTPKGKSKAKVDKECADAFNQPPDSDQRRVTDMFTTKRGCEEIHTDSSTDVGNHNERPAVKAKASAINTHQMTPIAKALAAAKNSTLPVSNAEPNASTAPSASASASVTPAAPAKTSTESATSHSHQATPSAEDEVLEVPAEAKASSSANTAQPAAEAPNVTEVSEVLDEAKEVGLCL